MSLKDIVYLVSYNKAENDIAEEFYLPSMRAATGYDRVSGYFSSTVYIIAWEALKEFMENGGHMRIVCSPVVSDEDAEALSEGYSARSDELMADALKKEVEELFENEYLDAPARLLAYLIANRIVDVQVAVPGRDELPLSRSMFHDKVGIFSDDNGNAVGFRGSMNETYKGLSSDGNLESIDVFPNWLEERDRQRLEKAESFFEKLWERSLPGTIVYPFPDAANEIIKRKAQGVEWEQLLEEIKTKDRLAEKWKPNHDKGGRTPRDYQTEALENWTESGRRGILQHATGSGKTFTAMCAINKALLRGETVLILVPSKELLRQWYDELRETLTDYEVEYLLCGDNNTEWKKNGMLSKWTEKSPGPYRIVISVMATASGDDFIKMVSGGEHLFMVADEVHDLGSSKRRRVFGIQTGARMGLSATPRRYGDPKGNEAIFDYFEKIVEPVFTLEDAIKSGALTRYFYHPMTVQLTKTEQEEWDAATKEINKLIARLGGEDVDIDSNPRLKQMFINRARIIKNAEGKVALAVRVLKDNYRPKDRWIVYCDNIKQLKAVREGLKEEGLNAYEYHSQMEGDREATLTYFSINGGILVSIKCLDEGVDIPSTTHALILASSQNPREFIQRRGRVLRKAEGKTSSHIYDAITMPVIKEDEEEQNLSIITTELSRAIHFGKGASNPGCITDLQLIANKYNIDYETIKDGGIENDGEQG